MTSLPVVKVAACHAAPVFLDAAATTEKVFLLIDEAASAGAHLICLPESFIPGFPLWAATSAPVDSGDFFSRFVEASIYADGLEISRIREKAKEKSVVVSLGFSERSRHSVGCLWNSNVLIDEQGVVRAHHRKLVPTYYEKLVWSNGDGAGLVVTDTANAGKVGVLICGENTNPLARYAMMAQGEQVHVQSYPPAWPTKRTGGYLNKTANAVRGAAHSFEAKCFTVVCAAILDEKTKRTIVEHDESAKEVLDNATNAVSQFFGPDGVQIGQELCEQEGIAYAEFDLNLCIPQKQLHDVVGGYQRYDVFDLKIDRTRNEPVQWQ
jgi:nitrilase